MAGLDLVGIDEAALEQHVAQAEEPFLVIGRGEIDLRRQQFPREARHVDVPDAGRAHGAVHRQHAAFPRLVERRLVRFSTSTLPKPSMPPMSWTPFMPASSGSRQAGADHRVAGDDLGELLLAPAFGACGPHRHDQEARLGGGIPHPDFGVLGQRDAEIVEHAARVLDRARAIGRGLVPDRRQAEHFPRIAGAQRADDHVVASSACSRPRPDDRRRG